MASTKLSTYMKLKVLISFVLLGLIIFSCKNNSSRKSNLVLSDSISKAAVLDTTTIKEGEIPIFYNMYLSVEMTSLFKSIGATYNYKLLNSPNKVDKYIASTEKALNLGVYAVDLCYAKYFEQFDQASRYLKNMHKLSTEMGIPDDKFYLSVKRIETNLSNKDSLVKIANELYSTTDIYLRENERESSAALIIVGGWIESLYIATNLNKKQNSDLDLINRIAEQKYSLKNLIDLIKKYPNDKIAVEYLDRMTNLQNIFKTLDVNTNDMQFTNTQLQNIGKQIADLRKAIVG